MMGRSRDKSGKRPGVNEEEERRKMRESILKIFHERAQSPEGAVLVSDSKAETSGSQRNGNRATESVSSGSPPASQLGTKKRKRRCKVMTRQESSSHANKRTASVNHHVKSARSHLNKESQNRSRNPSCQKQDIGGHITRNRLTRRIGLFNPGKKSRTIYRDPPPVPESVQKDVEKTLQHILTKDGEDESWSSHPCKATATSTSTAAVVGRTSKHSRASTLTPDSASVDHGSGGKSPSVHSNVNYSSGNPRSATCPMSGGSSVQSDALFPKIMPYKDIAGSMLNYLEDECKQTFGDVDMLTVTCKELQKLLRQNQHTPEAVYSGEQTLEGDSSVQQSLFNNAHISSGESEINPLETFSPITLTRQAHIRSPASDSRHRTGHRVQDISHSLERDISHKNTGPDTFLQQLMAQSSTVQSRGGGQIESTYNQPHQLAKNAKGHDFQENAHERDITFSHHHHHSMNVLDMLDYFPHLSSQQQFWNQQYLPHHHGARNDYPQDQDYNFNQNQLHDILPPLRKPSLDSPSPPQKMSLINGVNLRLGGSN